MLKTNQKNLMLGILVALVLVMTVAFSVFQTNLNIEGTSNISNKWDIKITKIEAKEENIIGHAKDDKDNPAKAEDLTATFNALLYYPSDSITYDITLKNSGTLDATLNNIEKNIETNSDKIDIEFSGFKKGQVIKKNTEETVHVKVTYKEEVALLENNNIKYLNNKNKIEPTLLDTEEDKPLSTITIKFTFKQENESGVESSDKYLVSYDCDTNGGDSCSDYDEYIYSDVDLTHEGIKEGYEFVGWNTNKDATIGLTELSISNNTTLYAIYKKTFTLTYSKGSNVSSVGKEIDTCDIYNNNEVTCTKELPSITPNNGYTTLGWYKESVKVGEENTSYTFTEDTTLTSETIENNPLVITGKSNLKYTGEAQDLIEVTTNGVNDVYYSTSELTKDNYTNGSTTIPTGTTAGTYKVYYFSLGNDNYADSKGNIEVTIDKDTPTIILEEPGYGIINPTATMTFMEDSNIEGSFTHESGTTSVATVSPEGYSSVEANTKKAVNVTGENTTGTSSIKVTFTPIDTTNYKTAEATYTIRNTVLPTITDNGGGSVTITYPNGICQVANVTCKYSINGKTTPPTFTNLTTSEAQSGTKSVTLSEDNTVIARVEYGSNFISASKFIVLPTAETTLAKLGTTVVTNEAGLYDNGDGSYTYKGANPNNYLEFNGENWRIMGILKNGTIKIIKDEKLSEQMSFDKVGIRITGYCKGADYYGCNAWAKMDNFSTNSNSGEVTQDSTLNLYLNEDYYVNTLKKNINIVKGNFNIGPQYNETSYSWNGYIALATQSEYTAAGGSSSYLYKNSYYWVLLSSSDTFLTFVNYVNKDGTIKYTYAYTKLDIRPVLHLSANIKLSGTGEQGANAYKIIS